MTKHKPKPTEHQQPARRTDDAERAAVEASQLLGLGDDPSRLCPADRLRCDLVATLRIAIDHAGATAMEGGSADVGRLVSAVEQLTRLLPPKAIEAPSHHRADPRKALLELIMQQRERDGIPDEGISEVAALKAEIAALKAGGLTGRAAGLPVVPPEVDIVPPGERAARDPGMRPGPNDSKPPVTIDVDAVDIRGGFGNVEEPWRQFSTDVEGNPLSGRGRKYWGVV